MCKSHVLDDEVQVDTSDNGELYTTYDSIEIEIFHGLTSLS